MIDTNQLMISVFGPNLVEKIGPDYLLFASIFIFLLVFLKVFELYIVRILKKLAKKSETKLDDAIIDFIGKIPWKAYIVLSLYVSSKTLVLPKYVDASINVISLIVVVYFAVKFFHAIVDYYSNEQVEKATKLDKNEDTTLISILSKIAKLIIWMLALLLILSNLGINVTSLIAGLGIGGIAIAFALQNILQDLFSSFTIYFDKPFKKGHFIVIGTDKGVIKDIGLKSTRIQTLQGEELIVSNRELTNTRINNYKRMKKRRIVFSFGVEYGTPVKKLNLAKKIVIDIFSKANLAELDRVHFNQFGDFSLNFEVVYYLNSSEYLVYMDTQEKINLAIKAAFEKNKIVMAFPTQTIYVKKD